MKSSMSAGIVALLAAFAAHGQSRGELLYEELAADENTLAEEAAPAIIA